MFFRKIKSLIKIGKIFHENNWSVATSSNYSFRVKKNKIIITASGKDKMNLNFFDFVKVDLKKDRRIKTHGKKVPSAETFLHVYLYNKYKHVESVLHTHSIFSGSLVNSKSKELILKNYEMLKVFSKNTTHLCEEKIPILKNSQDMNEIIEDYERYCKQSNVEPKAFLIKGHGLYTWGESIDVTRYQIEALEYLFECEYKRVGGIK